MNKIPNRFMAFMESLTDGSWEYGDGEPMGEDAKMALHYIHSIEEKTTVLQARDCNCGGGGGENETAII